MKYSKEPWQLHLQIHRKLNKNELASILNARQTHRGEAILWMIGFIHGTMLSSLSYSSRVQGFQYTVNVACFRMKHVL